MANTASPEGEVSEQNKHEQQDQAQTLENEELSETPLCTPYPKTILRRELRVSEKEMPNGVICRWIQAAGGGTGMGARGQTLLTTTIMTNIMRSIKKARI